MLNDLNFKTTCNIRPNFLGPMGGLKLEGPLYSTFGLPSGDLNSGLALFPRVIL